MSRVTCVWSSAVFQPLRCVSVSGFIYRNCSENGWSEPYPPYEDACEFIEYEKTELEVKAGVGILNTCRHHWTRCCSWCPHPHRC